MASTQYSPLIRDFTMYTFAVSLSEENIICFEIGPTPRKHVCLDPDQADTAAETIDALVVEVEHTKGERVGRPKRSYEMSIRSYEGKVWIVSNEALTQIPMPLEIAKKAALLLRSKAQQARMHLEFLLKQER